MSSSPSDRYPDWQAIIKNLLASAWRDAPFDNTVKLDRWLRNFTGQVLGIEDEQLHAFHLLIQLIFFGKKEVSECLRVLFQEKIVYPYVQTCKTAGHSPDQTRSLFQAYLSSSVRILGVGHPAESGQALLSPFRRINGLSAALFPPVQDVVKSVGTGAATNIIINPVTLKRIIYIDDFCGTGEQVQVRTRSLITALKIKHPSIEIDYYPLVATKRALNLLNTCGLFTRVSSVITLDEDYRIFSSDSQYYKSPPSSVDQNSARRIMEHYGSKLVKTAHVLGHKDSQLLVSFEQNTPDNTIPVIWSTLSNLPWHPIFPRAHKF